MFGLVGLTFIVLLNIPIARFRAYFAGRVTTNDFRLGESADVPEGVRLPNRNYMNLLELPILFYVGCLALYVTDRADTGMYTLAWVYVALRALHSLIHLTYNNVIHRLSVFALSNFVLAALWIRFFLSL
ncbi:MAG TPA: MAPEG family protein [Polyangiales bacterium]|jgi:hypothetical protein|nr:MAPEG family protein [Polyangiales bacterium]